MNQIVKKQTVVNDLLITYYVGAGSKKNPPILFLHGWRSQSTLWFSVASPLVETGHTCILLDLPGFGESQKPGNPWTHTDYCELVTAFCEKLKLSPIVLIGHSFGGSIGIRLAAKSPHLIEKLLLVDSSGIRKKTIKRSVKQIIAKFLKPIFLMPFLRPIKMKIYQRMGAEDYLATPELQQTYLNVIKEDLTPLLSQISTPTLILWGENDKETPVSFANTMHNLIPHSQLRVFTQTGHFSFLDKPKEFVDAVEKFIEKDAL